MQASIKRVLTAPIFLLLLPAYHALHSAAFHFGAITAAQANIFILETAGLSCLILLLLSRLTKRKVASFAFVCMGMLLYLNWGILLRAAKAISPFTLKWPWVLLCISVTGITLIAYILFDRISKTVQQKLFIWVNSLLLLLTLIEAAMLMIKAGKKIRPAFDTADIHKYAAIKPESLPDTYLLLFDEYTSTRSLSENYQYDNSTQDSFLKEQGFDVVEDAHANYQWTHFSVSSLLNMDYIATFRDSSRIDTRDYLHTYDWINENKVMQVFKNAGYSIHNYSLFSAGGQERIAADRFVPIGRQLLQVGTLHGQICTLKKYFMVKPAVDTGTTDASSYLFQHWYNKAVHDSVTALLSAGRSKPAFVYAHYLLPHSPFYYDAAGNIVPEDSANARFERMDRDGYINNVRQANRLMQQTVSEILHADSTATIIILGDHGLRRYKGEQKKSIQFRCYLAYRFANPTPNAKHEGIHSLVNVFRMVLNRQLGYSLRMLPHEEIELLH